ncbi:MAG: hypothetical protein AAF529_12865 [Pseudomonadota bacterium]
MGDELGTVDPNQLVHARAQAHQACQWASKAARANLVARPDDSHSNFGWSPDLGALVTESLDADRALQAGFSFAAGELLWLRHGQVEATLAIADREDRELSIWLDEHLAGASLSLTEDAHMPYALEEQVPYEPCPDEMQSLGQWFDSGFAALASVRNEFLNAVFSAAQPRCWPHHFDVGMLLLLEDADPETARSVGLGLSPGDASFAQPYYYCNPWPVPAAETLGQAPAGFHWHTQGFTSLIALASDLDVESPHADMLRAPVARCMDLLAT